MVRNTPALSELFFGYTDGKHEFFEIDEETFVRSYYVPENLNLDSIIDGQKYIVNGPRGSGKTTLLRWLAYSLRQDRLTPFLLFKSDISEEEKQDYSKAAGIKEIALTGPSKGVLQDFRDLWRILIITRLCSCIVDNSHAVKDIRPIETILRIAGASSVAPNFFDNFLPNILSLARIKWQDVTSGVEWEAGLWGAPPNPSENMTLSRIAKTIIGIFTNVHLLVPITLFLDELEIFYKSAEQFTRDCDLIRDSILVSNELRVIFRNSKTPVGIVLAVREEVVKTIGARGEEIYKIVDDFSVHVSWAQRQATATHPLIRLLGKKMISRLDESSKVSVKDIFPERISGAPYFQYLTDNTCCKPRNLVSRLKILQERYPNSTSINEEMLKETEAEYSGRIWKEVEYLLGASFDEATIAGLKRLLYAGPGRFQLHDLNSRMLRLGQIYRKEMSALERGGIVPCLERMFEYGAVGNVYNDRAAARTMYIWSYRGEDVFQANKPMELQRALWKHLSIVGAQAPANEAGERL